ncbi:hydrolase [Agaricicola taiwanensis]|uniref:Hydrolase n=1 Tax=Agaricicola taiwanensis TaxID=591372 RepID=A0A8J2VLL3_9RHOB|nr:amidohydrolase family protein [Agaricicola taiwanensis]GGE36574.1 hydrolase [Agaricicola taiwanensis]
MLTEAKTRVLGTIQSRPHFPMPAGACDCHVHVFGPFDRFPLWAGRAYTPAAVELDDLRAHQAALGLERVVLVQPSVYGTDNSCLVDALQRLGGCARGVAVLAEADQRELARLHEAGVRGLRVNLGTHGIDDPNIARQQLARAVHLAEPRGWHLQVYAPLRVLLSIEDTLRGLPLPLVLDHFAMAEAAAGVDQAGFSMVLDLVATGRAYVKLSAPHRVSHRSDYADVVPFAHALIAANAERLVWASDWPHRDGTGFRAEDDGLALNRLAEWVPDPAVRQRILADNPARLYDF